MQTVLEERLPKLYHTSAMCYSTRRTCTLPSEMGTAGPPSSSSEALSSETAGSCSNRTFLFISFQIKFGKNPYVSLYPVQASHRQPADVCKAMNVLDIPGC